MASRPKTPMPIHERAKQFLPFAAVKGLPEALEKKEKIPVLRIEISDEKAFEINEKLSKAQKGTLMTVTYYEDETYVQLTGTLIHIDVIYKTLQLDDVEIRFEDLLDVSG